MTLCIFKSTLIHQFLFIYTRGVETNKKFMLINIIQGLLQLCNKGISSNLIKMKALFMASISKATFNINGLIIHLSLNIRIQQSNLIYQTYQQTH